MSVAPIRQKVRKLFRKDVLMSRNGRSSGYPDENMTYQGGSSRMKSNSPTSAEVVVLRSGSKVRAPILNPLPAVKSLILAMSEMMKVDAGYLTVRFVSLFNSVYSHGLIEPRFGSSKAKAFLTGIR